MWSEHSCSYLSSCSWSILCFKPLHAASALATQLRPQVLLPSHQGSLLKRSATFGSLASAARRISCRSG